MSRWLAKFLLKFARLMVAIRIAPSFFQSLVAAGAVSEGRSEFNSGAYKEALRILRPVADYEIEDAFVARAQYIVALIYRDGLAGHADLEIAKAYLKRASDLGNEDAMRLLSNISNSN